MSLTCLLLARAELSNGDIVNETQGPEHLSLPVSVTAEKEYLEVC